MKVAVIGAGVTGLVSARRLALHGHTCDVYERWPGLGGQVATLDVGDGHLLERYYHHLFPSDNDIIALYEELGMADAIRWLPSSVAVFADEALHPFTTPLDLLRFKPMPLWARLRMGIAVLSIQLRHTDVGPFEDVTAKDWIRENMGGHAWNTVWGPLLRGKFGPRATDISMAWIWSKLTIRRQIKGSDARRERLGYPEGGWQPLLERLRVDIEATEGRVLINRPAAFIEQDGEGFLITAGEPESFRRGHDPREFDSAEAPSRYDAVVATVPSDIFRTLLSPSLACQLGDEYVSRVSGIEYHTALCLLLELDRRFSEYYWTNIADTDLPFVGLIEQTNLLGPEHYGGRRFLYVANYLEPGNELLDLGADEVLARYDDGLKRLNPAFDRSWVKNFWLFCEPAAQPIVTIGYQHRIPEMATPVPRLLLANTTQIYPEDRGTNYSVRLGERATQALLGAI